MTPENAVKTLRRQAQTAQRVAALRERRAQAGLARLELWAHPEDHAAIKAAAQRLAKRRNKVATK